MTDWKLPLILVAAGAAIALAEFTPQDPVKPPQAPPDARVQSLRDLLVEQHEVVVTQLDDHTDRLKALQDSRVPPTVEPPELPEPVAQPNQDQPPETVVGQEATLPVGWSITLWSASWCGICTDWKTNELPRFAPGEVTELDFDAATDKQGVTKLPTFDLMKDGKRVLRVVGTRTFDQLQQSIQKRQATASRGGPPTSQPVRRGPVILRDQWGSYRSDNSYHCGRNCPMCDARRARRQREGWMSSIKPGQEPARKDQADDAIETLHQHGLGPDSVFADIGCGDGAVLIEAVRATGCRAVGIEIDPRRADAARDNARDHGVADRIHVITADARDVDLERLGVTHVYTFLFSDLLEELRGKLERYPVAAVYHPIPGRQPDRLKNGIYFYEAT